MFKKILNLVIQDTKIMFRTWFIYSLIFMCVVIIVLVNFIIPSEMNIMSKEIFFYEDGSDILELAVKVVIYQDSSYKTIEEKENAIKEHIKSSKEELREAVVEDVNRIGIAIEGGLDNTILTIIHHGIESEKILNLIESMLGYVIKQLKIVKVNEEDIRNSLTDPGKLLNLINNFINSEKSQELNNDVNYHTDFLREESESVSINKGLIPPFLVMEVIMLAFMIISIMVLQEKTDGSIKAYRVSPSGIWIYMASKLIIAVLMGLIYGFILIVFTIGFNVNYLYLFIILFLSCLLLSIMGLAISVFFNSLSDWVFGFLGVMIVLVLPMISYFNPAFSSPLINWIPAYPIIFGVREIVFPTGKDSMVLTIFLILAIECVIFFIISYFTVKKKLMKEGR